MRVGLQRGSGAASEVAEVAGAVFAVERLEAFPAEDVVELSQGVGSVRPFVDSLAGIHQLLNEPAEELWGFGRPVVGSVEDGVDDVGDPPVAGGSVVDKLGSQIGEELGDDRT